MNKYQEALKRLKQETAPNTYCADFDKEKCINTLQELVDKATPKKPIYSSDPLFAYMRFCPVCNKSIPFTNSYCGHCGQKLDWSDEDENS